MNMHWCVCKVNSSGQGFYIVDINESSPVSWPEVHVLSALHGEDNIYEIKPVRVSETTARIEKDRLLAKYGHAIVDRVFPGRVFRMEMLMPGEPTDQGLADNEGVTIGNSDEGGDSGDEMPLPSTAAVFKPGKQRPASV